MAANKEPDIEGRVLALAHQLERFIGATERRTEGWLDSDAGKSHRKRTVSARGAQPLTVNPF